MQFLIFLKGKFAIINEFTFLINKYLCAQTLIVNNLIREYTIYALTFLRSQTTVFETIRDCPGNSGHMVRGSPYKISPIQQTSFK